MAAVTVISFPAFIGVMTGISYLRIGVRKVWVTLTDGQTLSIPRQAFPSNLPPGNELAFEAARIVCAGPAKL